MFKKTSKKNFRLLIIFDFIFNYKLKIKDFKTLIIYLNSFIFILCKFK